LIEIVDVLDPVTGEAVGRKPKPDVHRDGDWHRAAHVWFVTPDGRILLQKRSVRKENHPGFWDVSCAGHVSAGETAMEAAIRECEEELGLRVEPAELLPVGITRESHIINDGRYIDREIHEVFLVRRPIDVGALRLQPEEVDDAKLVSAEELQEMIGRGELVDHSHEYALLFAVL
jgi:isopentenyl-diphosphate delta-isomerase